MKKNILSTTAAFLMISACSDKPREEIISRYDTGEKELIVVYMGNGEGERVLNKTWYHKNGFQVKHQAFEDDATTTKDFTELNSSFKTAEGLFDYLSGKWVFWEHSDEKELVTSYRFNNLTSEPPVMEFLSNDSIIIHNWNDNAIEKNAFPLKLMGEFNFTMTKPIDNQPEELVFRIEMISPDSMKIFSGDSKEDRFMIAFREDSSELSSIKLKAMAEKAYFDRLLNR